MKHHTGAFAVLSPFAVLFLEYFNNTGTYVYIHIHIHVYKAPDVFDYS